MLPTFLVIGAQKAGTTSMHAYLAQHPDVFVARQKELNFFTDLEFHRGLDWYAEQFADAGNATARGDVSPLYTAYPWLRDVPERVAAHLPGVKLVYLLRHPIERTVSNYRYQVAMGVETLPIEQAVFSGNPAQYISRSKYATQIEQWLPHIDRRDLLCVTSEELRADHVGVMRRIYAHIGVDPDAPLAPPAPERNRTEEIRLDRTVSARLRRSRAWPLVQAVVPGPVRRAVWERVGSRHEAPPPENLAALPAVRQRLLEVLRPDLERLPAYLGPDFDCWGLLVEAPA
jgi:hypothetical protein